MKKSYKRCWILIVGSVATFFISVILHNFFYGAHILTAHIPIIGLLTEALHVIFFLISIFICPIALAAGIANLIIIFIRKHKLSKNE